uniref:Uncharacterized protein n=1 Tax=Glossina austeni TaxID=7395 RepID=A0A1A9UXX2_GLOAU
MENLTSHISLLNAAVMRWDGKPLPGDRGVGFMSPEPIEVRNACRAICRCRITCSFRARSLLYIGPNLFLPPRIRSALTAVNNNDHEELKDRNETNDFNGTLEKQIAKHLVDFT